MKRVRARRYSLRSFFLSAYHFPLPSPCFPLPIFYYLPALFLSSAIISGVISFSPFSLAYRSTPFFTIALKKKGALLSRSDASFVQIISSVFCPLPLAPCPCLSGSYSHQGSSPIILEVAARALALHPPHTSL